MNFWLVKSEPFKYSWEKFEKDKITTWDGVRNYAARNNLREMKTGEQCFFYHSNEGKEIVGIAKIVKESYQDPTTEDPNWVVVDLAPVNKLKKTVTLEQIKAEDRLAGISLIKLSCLSVHKISKSEFDIILELSQQK